MPAHEPAKDSLKNQVDTLLKTQFDFSGDYNNPNHHKGVYDGVWQIKPGLLTNNKITTCIKKGLEPDYNGLFTLTRGKDGQGAWHVPSKKETVEYFNGLYGGNNWDMVPVMQTQFVETDRYADLKKEQSGYLPFAKKEDIEFAWKRKEEYGPERGTKRDVDEIEERIKKVLESDPKSLDTEFTVCMWSAPQGEEKKDLSPESRRRAVYNVYLQTKDKLHPEEFYHEEPDPETRARKGEMDILASRTYYKTNTEGVFMIRERRWNKGHEDWGSTIEIKILREDPASKYYSKMLAEKTAKK